MIKILAVTMLDYKVSGRDQFYVQVSEDKENAVMIYYVFTDGRVIPLRKQLYSLVSVISAVEKFNAGYYVKEPVEVEHISDLPKYLGKFEILGPGYCRYNPDL
jgi:hypothetical protein